MMILVLLLTIFRVHINYGLYLILTLLLWQDKLIDQPIFTNHDTLLVDNIIEFTVILLQNVIFIVFVLLVVLEILIASATVVALHVVFSVVLVVAAIFALKNIGFTLTFLLSMLVVQLFENVLNLSLELVINLVHQVLEHLWHT